MSSNRTCMMSDLRAAESRLENRLSSIDSVARRAEANAEAARKGMDKVQKRVDGLLSDVNDLQSGLSSVEADVQGLSQAVSNQRNHIYQIDAEITGLEAQQQADHSLINHHQNLISSIQQDIESLDDSVEENRQLISVANQNIEVLQHEAAVASQRIANNSHHIQNLEVGVQQINHYLEEQQRLQEQQRASQLADVNAQQKLALTLRQFHDNARVRRFGSEHLYLTALTTLDHADESARLGQLEAARATYQDAQRQFSQVAREVDAREREFFRYRSQCEASLKQLEITLMNSATEDMLYWHKTDYQALESEFQSLQRWLESGDFERAGRPEQIVALLEQKNKDIVEFRQKVDMLNVQLQDTILKDASRRSMLNKMLDALMDVWGDNDFDATAGHIVAEDPKSTLKVQTVRPNRANVTLYLDLDGTVQFSWTGYVGMDCAKDFTDFENALHSRYNISAAVVGNQEKPGQPNPDFGPHPSSPKPAEMPREQHEQKQERKS